MKRMYDENEIKSIASEAGGGKYYIHDVSIYNNDTPSLLPLVKFKYISKDNNKFTLDKFYFHKCFDVYTTDANDPPKFYNVNSMKIRSDKIFIEYYSEYPLSTAATGSANIPITSGLQINDDITEL